MDVQNQIEFNRLFITITASRITTIMETSLHKTPDMITDAAILHQQKTVLKEVFKPKKISLQKVEINSDELQTLLSVKLILLLPLQF